MAMTKSIRSAASNPLSSHYLLILTPVIPRAPVTHLYLSHRREQREQATWLYSSVVQACDGRVKVLQTSQGWTEALHHTWGICGQLFNRVLLVRRMSHITSVEGSRQQR